MLMDEARAKALELAVHLLGDDYTTEHVLHTAKKFADFIVFGDLPLVKK